MLDFIKRNTNFSLCSWHIGSCMNCKDNLNKYISLNDFQNIWGFGMKFVTWNNQRTTECLGWSCRKISRYGDWKWSKTLNGSIIPSRVWSAYLKALWTKSRNTSKPLQMPKHIKKELAFVTHKSIRKFIQGLIAPVNTLVFFFSFILYMHYYAAVLHKRKN